MKYLLIISTFLICNMSVFAAEDSQVNMPIQTNTILALKERREILRSWAPKCSDGSLTMHNCPFWDAVEYMGMLCLSGETEYCSQVKDAQDETGRWWRSPGFRHNPDPNEKEATFSRDMDRGVWGYIVATKDKEAALRYMSFVKENDYHLCPRSIENWNACTTRATYWTFVTQVFDWLELPRDKKKMKNYKFAIEALYSPIEAMTQPTHYEMILTAEMLYTYKKMQDMGANLRNKNVYKKIAKIIHRRVPDVPFYEYLVYGPNESSAQKILKICPTQRPNVPEVGGWPQYSEPGNGPWEIGSGHYCIFMINAILGSAK
ncbi:MAG: hypothetical protein K2P81_00785 [Bacteriovoracaceae bacterium]|nr:hypothetical protein [Bacteriovoracaceae bacterium]